MGARICLIAAHPDDEVIGAGGQLAGWRDCLIVHVTDGAPRDMKDAAAHGFRTREAYACARRRELLAALGLAGIPAARTRWLGIADQEASRDLAGLARGLAAILRGLRPELVLTHAYEGGHPDHDATAFAVHAAARLMEDAPAIQEFTGYHACAGRMATGTFLPYAGCGVRTLELAEEARARKRRMLECFATQAETLRPFHSGVERFRQAPAYDFARRPAPEVYYDWFDWGMRSGEWVEAARSALAALELEGPL